MASTEEQTATKEVRAVCTFRATKAELRQIEDCAKSAGLPRCTWIREISKQALPLITEEKRQLLLRIDWQLHALGVNLNQLVHLAHIGKIRSARNFREIIRDLKEQIEKQRDMLLSACRTEEE